MTFSITLLIIIFTCLVSYRALTDQQTFERLKHYPYQESRTKEYYRLLSSGFVHGDYIHLAVNMYVLYMFGETVEKTFEQAGLFGKPMGKVIFFLLYLANVIAASVPTYFKHKDNPGFASIGASGATSGILFIFIVLYPYAPLNFIFIPIDIPAIILGIGYLVYSSYAAKKGGARIDHMAHFYGAIFGIAMFWILKPRMIRHFINSVVDGLPF